MKWPGRYRVLRAAAVFALLALALIMWSFFDHRPLVLVAAMSVGQAIGTGSLLLFLAVVLVDLRKANVLGDGPGDRPQGDEPSP